MYPSLQAYKQQIDGRTCRWCQASLNAIIHHYDHAGGYPVAGFASPQWLYVVCPKCDHQWSLKKLGIVPPQEGL